MIGKWRQREKNLKKTDFVGNFNEFDSEGINIS